MPAPLRTLLLTLLCLWASLGAPAAMAHPMGTLSTNRSGLLSLKPDQTRLQYTVDFAELPSVPELERVKSLGEQGYADARMAELLPGLHISVDGAARPLTVHRCLTSVGEGEGALPVVMLVCTLETPAITAGRVRLQDDNFEGLVGWRELRFAGDGVGLGDGDPASALSDGPLPLPFSSAPETMNLTEVQATVGGAATAGAVGATEGPAQRKPDHLVELISGEDLSPRFVLIALLSALVLGAGHALSPGHGKTVVAAYLVGSRGTVGQALLLGLTVTATHVSSVLLLGGVTLWLSQYVVAAELYPWIGVSSGLGVVAVGGGLLRSRWRTWRAYKQRAVEAAAALVSHDHDHDHEPVHSALRLNIPPGEAVAIPPAQASWLEHDHGPGGHEHIHHDDRGEPVKLGRLLVLGITGGAVPCPSALVVLLAAIAMHRVLFGMLLIVSFSVGLAAVLMAIGVMVVRAGALLNRASGAGKAAVWLPVASATVVIVLGLGIAIQSAREGGLI